MFQGTLKGSSIPGEASQEKAKVPSACVRNAGSQQEQVEYAKFGGFMTFQTEGVTEIRETGHPVHPSWDTGPRPQQRCESGARIAARSRH